MARRGSRINGCSRSVQVQRYLARALCILSSELLSSSGGWWDMLECRPLVMEQMSDTRSGGSGNVDSFAYSLLSRTVPTRRDSRGHQASRVLDQSGRELKVWPACLKVMSTVGKQRRRSSKAQHETRVAFSFQIWGPCRRRRIRRIQSLGHQQGDMTGRTQSAHR